MAKRRIVRPEKTPEDDGKGDGEDKKKPAFKPPEFDETEFLQTENRSAKLIYISLGTALAAGIVTYFVMNLLHMAGAGGEFTIPLVVPVLFIFVAIMLFGKFGINVKNLEWKKWLENGFMYFLAWFAIWLISMNPPFSDFSEPVISDPVIEVEIGSDQITMIHYLGDDMYVEDRKQDASTPMSDLDDVRIINVYTAITDNWEVKDVSISLQYRHNGSWVDMEEAGLMNITIGRYREKLDFGKNVSSRLDDEWLITDDEVLEDYLYVVSINMTGQVSLDLSGGVSMRIVYEASDTRGNESGRVVEFRISS
ncbi:MAG TPA: hypothetical protein ENK47_04955 [Euryarchaeota archaeon]|nr:MAG: hypothetical protein B6U90_03970 [Thermoplasmatales archaeon ex4484_6]RLF65881.1 MAG: hypothetical protein DRN57_08205 [Thermoplasmata archaeon]HHD16038.1 hypothetical protein [Euryarchaeota archaeon]